ncbi:MAG: hypothetical protein F4Z29_04830 [Gemmatimonadetes bacterium]|nr:hypothetical protein [Gemmatimonadota bacterium]
MGKLVYLMSAMVVMMSCGKDNAMTSPEQPMEAPVASTPDPEAIALVALYDATGGEHWRDRSNWGSGRPIGEWYGVTVNSENRVVGLNLAYNNLAGEIPEALGQLTALRELDLSHNRLSGNIPEAIGELENLSTIFVDSNKAMTGPLPPALLGLTLKAFWTYDTQLCVPEGEAFGEWRNAIANGYGMIGCGDERSLLVAFYEHTGGPGWKRSDNWLSTAPVGDWFGIETDETGAVVRIALDDNNLRGSLPPQIGRFMHLQVLRLKLNRLGGTIPKELARLEKLRTIEFGGNALSGPIPPELGSLSRLEDLALYENQLTGPIPAELGQLGKLEWLSVSRNGLVGSIPSELGDLMSLRLLFLYGNDLSGPIPPELGGLENLTALELHDNRLSGEIPSELGQLRKVERFILSDNELEGSIPPELGGMTNVRTLWLDSNRLSGPIPPSLASLDNLAVLWLYNNRLSGPIPPELGEMESLTRLSLSANNLSGVVPQELGRLSDLTVFLVRDNAALAGPLPESFLQLDLLVLWLSGTEVCIPTGTDFTSWMDQIEDLQGGLRCGAVSRTVRSVSAARSVGTARSVSEDLDAEERRLRWNPDY